MGKMNQKLLGELQYVIFYHKFITVMLFPLDTFQVLAAGTGKMQRMSSSLHSKSRIC